LYNKSKPDDFGVAQPTHNRCALSAARIKSILPTSLHFGRLRAGEAGQQEPVYPL
jgi:hypothetical protein